ncbi:MAG: hypothetical protein ACRYFB_15445 [Janthinobacterium lividum]
MKKILFTGWRKGMNKIEFIQLLHHSAGVPLRDAKSIKDRIVDGEVIEIEVNESIAQYIIDGSRQYGVDAEE